jgi:hypothetical protein
VTYLIAFISLFLMISASAAEPGFYVAETEVHSTAGIGNRVRYRDEQTNPQQLPPDDSSPYFEEDTVREELSPPTTVEKISPTRSRVITQTTSRPSNNNPQSGGIGIAPVVVPVYDGGQGYQPLPPRIYNPPPATRR